MLLFCQFLFNWKQLITALTYIIKKQREYLIWLWHKDVALLSSLISTLVPTLVLSLVIFTWALGDNAIVGNTFFVVLFHKLQLFSTLKSHFLNSSRDVCGQIHFLKVVIGLKSLVLLVRQTVFLQALVSSLFLHENLSLFFRLCLLITARHWWGEHQLPNPNNAIFSLSTVLFFLLLYFFFHLCQYSWEDLFYLLETFLIYISLFVFKKCTSFPRMIIQLYRDGMTH